MTNHPYLIPIVLYISIRLIAFILSMESDHYYKKRREKIYKKELQGNNPAE